MPQNIDVICNKQDVNPNSSKPVRKKVSVGRTVYYG